MMHRMKVLHVIPSVSERSGGPATAIVPMCRALMQHGIEVLLATTDAGLSLAEARNGDVVKYKGVPAIFFESQLGESFKYSRPMAAWLRANIRQFDVVHVHAVFNHSSVATARACSKSGVPYVIRPLGTLDPWSMTQKARRKRLFWQVAGKSMLQRAARVHYTSEAEKLASEEMMGMNHGSVIALGVEANSATSREKLAQYFPELARGPYVLVLSRLHPKKGLDVLIDAFGLLVQRPEFTAWRLVLAGDGDAEYVSMLKAKASLFAGRIIFTGWLEGERKNAVLNGASLLALPSHQENFGLCVMEALSHSVPVLVSANVNLAAEIASADAGWVAAIDRDALCAKLAEVLGDREELARRGRAGLELSRKYSWERTAQELVQLYQSVVAG